jgi:cystathionine beta-synthase
MIGVDPIGSVLTYYHQHRELPPPEKIHQYLVDGVGEDFVPASVWWDYIDDMIKIDDHTAYRALFELCRKEAIFTGSSGGLAVAGARQVAQSLPDDALVVTLLPDSGERYLSKLNDEWMRSRGLLDS